MERPVNSKTPKSEKIMETAHNSVTRPYIQEPGRILGFRRILREFSKDPERTLVVCQRQYGQKPARTFAKNIGAKSMVGRFVPGTLTNPLLPTFFEPDVIVVTDPSADQQALREAVNIGIPVVALCDANNDLKHVDLAIPANNKGRRSLALVFWLLTREVLRSKKVITRDDEFNLELDEFEATL